MSQVGALNNNRFTGENGKAGGPAKTRKMRESTKAIVVGSWPGEYSTIGSPIPMDNVHTKLDMAGRS